MRRLVMIPHPVVIGVLGLALAALSIIGVWELVGKELCDSRRGAVEVTLLFAMPPIDLNTATPNELAMLPGVGPALAARIDAHRRERGLFACVEDVDAVEGIGPVLLERMRPFVCVSLGQVPAAPLAQLD